MPHYPELTDQRIIDAGHDALCRIALTALSTTPLPEPVTKAQRELRDDLIGIARLLMNKARDKGREIHA